MIRRDPNHRPPPAWPPNPPNPQQRPVAPATAALPAVESRCAPTTATAGAAGETKTPAASRRPRGVPGVGSARRGFRRRRVLDRDQAAPHRGAARLRRPARRGQGHHMAVGRLGQQAGAFAGTTERTRHRRRPRHRPDGHHHARARPGVRIQHADHDGVDPPRLVRGDPRLRRPTRSTLRSSTAAPRCWPRPSNRQRASGSTTTQRSGSTGSRISSTPSAG